MRVLLLAGAIAALLVSPLGAASAASDHMDPHDLRWAYGPEEWKGGLPGTWSASLGTAMSIPLTADGDVTFEAVLSDGNVEVQGIEVFRSGDDVLVSFDVDGQRALPGQAATLPLAPGEWSLQIEAYEAGPGPLSAPLLLNRTTLAFDTAPVELLGVQRDGLPLALAPVPESEFPHLRDVAAGPDVLLPWASLLPGNVTLSYRSQAGMAWHLWQIDGLVAAKAPSVPGGPTPADPVVEAPLPLGVSMTDLGDGAGWHERDRSISAELAQGLYVASAVSSAGGSAVVALLVANATPTFASLYPTSFAGIAGLDVTVDLGGATALGGEVLALTAGDDGGRLLSRSPLVVLPDGTARTTLEANALRAAGVPAVRLVAFLHGVTGDYAGHTMALRGLDAELHVPLLGMGEPVQIGVSLTNLGTGAASGHAVNASVTLWAGGDMVGERNVTVNPGATVVPAWFWAPDQVGAVQLRAEVETGDLSFDVRKSATVLDEDAYRSERAKWYEPERYTAPGPSPLVVFALLGAGLLAARGRTRNG